MAIDTTGQTGYGGDVWCMTEMQPGRWAQGRTAVLQAYYRRLTTPRGMLRGLTDEDEEGAYGYDVTSEIGNTTTPAAAIASRVAGELRKDDRTRSVAATGSEENLGAGMRRILIEVEAVLVDDTEPLRFTLRISDLDGVEVLADLTTG